MVSRQNTMITTGVSLAQMAVSGLFSKDGQKDLTKILKGLSDE